VSLLQSSKFDYHFHLPPASFPKSDECCGVGFCLALASAYLRRPLKEGVSPQIGCDFPRVERGVVRD
jgi:ATP-dependent Lon protease